MLTDVLCPVPKGTVWCWVQFTCLAFCGKQFYCAIFKLENHNYNQHEIEFAKLKYVEIYSITLKKLNIIIRNFGIPKLAF